MAANFQSKPSSDRSERYVPRDGLATTETLESHHSHVQHVTKSLKQCTVHPVQNAPEEIFEAYK